jgi:hypothetical protein
MKIGSIIFLGLFILAIYYIQAGSTGHDNGYKKGFEEGYQKAKKDTEPDEQ